MKLTPSPFAPEQFPHLPEIRGVRAATARCGFYGDRDDVFLFVFDEGTSCAGVFTRSATASADVLWCREALQAGGGKARALLVNAGNSNAFTGPAGVTKNEASLAAIGKALGSPKDQSFLAATGVIGEPLEDPNYVGERVPEMVTRLASPDWEACARAFMTTDTYPKGFGRARELGDGIMHIAGIAKGSGMIAPNMATMLAYVFTDASVSPDFLQEVLAYAVRPTFNAITVDGDTSTSDTVMLFATGASGGPPIATWDDPRAKTLSLGLVEACQSLAFQIVKDGEGASKFISVTVRGTASDDDARLIAASVANSPLVKTALAAGDANWGRIVMAVGKAGVPFDQRDLSIRFGDHVVAERGSRSPGYDEHRASALCAEAEIDIVIAVGSGRGQSTVYTCDLTHAYIDINGAYRT